MSCGPSPYTIYNPEFMGPPNIFSTISNPGISEMAYQEHPAVGFTETQYSVFQNTNARIQDGKTLKPLFVYKHFNANSCDNCLKTLAVADPALNQCLRFDAVLPNNSLTSVAMYDTSICGPVVGEALTRCQQHCGSVV
jgi:hypothetical protein